MNSIQVPAPIIVDITKLSESTILGLIADGVLIPGYEPTVDAAVRLFKDKLLDDSTDNWTSLSFARYAKTYIEILNTSKQDAGSKVAQYIAQCAKLMDEEVGFDYDEIVTFVKVLGDVD